jgi:hypothetical protein
MGISRPPDTESSASTARLLFLIYRPRHFAYMNPKLSTRLNTYTQIQSPSGQQSACSRSATSSEWRPSAITPHFLLQSYIVVLYHWENSANIASKLSRDGAKPMVSPANNWPGTLIGCLESSMSAQPGTSHPNPSIPSNMSLTNVLKRIGDVGLRFIVTAARALLGRGRTICPGPLQS